MLSRIVHHRKNRIKAPAFRASARGEMESCKSEIFIRRNFSQFAIQFLHVSADDSLFLGFNSLEIRIFRSKKSKYPIIQIKLLSIVRISSLTTREFKCVFRKLKLNLTLNYWLCHFLKNDSYFYGDIFPIGHVQSNKLSNMSFEW